MDGTLKVEGEEIFYIKASKSVTKMLPQRARTMDQIIQRGIINIYFFDKNRDSKLSGSLMNGKGVHFRSVILAVVRRMKCKFILPISRN